MGDFAVIPAIELRGGLALKYEVVGMATRATRVDPIAMAREFIAAGAPMLHIYNLDGPFIVSGMEHSGSVLAGAERNLTVVGELAKAVDVPIQFSGGVRDLESFKVVTQMGAQRAAIGSAAMRDPALVKQAMNHNADAVVVFLDVRDGWPAQQEWVQTPKASVMDVAKAVVAAGVKRFIYQDIDADSTGSGPRPGYTPEVAELGAEVVLSGGIQILEHVQKAAASKGASGVIVGKPLTSGRFTYAEALQAAAEGAKQRA